VWTPEKQEQAQRMLADGKSVSTVAKVLGISRATIYRAQMNPNVT
jgi:DNA invertase Pin-like site-specific DNA recombinase